MHTQKHTVTKTAARPPVAKNLERFKKRWAVFQGEHRKLRMRLPYLAIDEALYSFRPIFIDGLKELALIDKRLTPKQRKEAIAFARDSDLMRWALEAPYYRRIFFKPRGYAGDAEMMRIIYRAAYEGVTRFGRLYHRLATTIRESQAVRNRRALLARRLGELDHGARAMSLACGPCAEIIDAMANSSKDFSVLALDHDLETLREVAVRTGDPRLRLGLANALKMTRGKVPRALIPSQLNSFADITPNEQQPLRNWLRERRYDAVALEPRSFDLVYSAGLFDYLVNHPNDNTRGAQGLALRLWDLVAPGGELIIGNFGPGCAPGSRFYMEYVCDWNLVFRSAADLRALAAPFDDVARVFVDREPEGVNLFLRAVKR